LISVADERLQLRLYKRIVETGLSVRKIENSPKDSTLRKRSRHPSAPEFQSLEDKLRVALGTKVKIREERGSGEIVVEYYSHDDLDRLLDLLAGR